MRQRSPSGHGRPRAAFLSLLLVASTLLASCSDDEPAAVERSTEDTPAASAPSPSTPQPKTDTTEQESPTDEPEEEGESDAVVLEITLRDGQVEPAGAQVEAKVGEPIQLRVDSDTVEELHLHTTPDKSFDVKAANGQVFTFSIDQPGQVELETEGSGVLVAQLVVQP